MGGPHKTLYAVGERWPIILGQHASRRAFNASLWLYWSCQVRKVSMCKKKPFEYQQCWMSAWGETVSIFICKVRVLNYIKSTAHHILDSSKLGWSRSEPVPCPGQIPHKSHTQPVLQDLYPSLLLHICLVHYPVSLSGQRTVYLHLWSSETYTVYGIKYKLNDCSLNFNV